MNLKEIQERLAAISEEIVADGADVEALSAEADELVEQRNKLIEEEKAAEERAAKRAKTLELVANLETNEAKDLADDTKEIREMTNEEVRASEKYAKAYLDMIKGVTADDSECRALLTENVSGTVPVPTMLESEIRTAWEENTLMSFVGKSYFKGNVKIGFELSATGATVHTEGQNAPDEETVSLGTVTITNESIKKWITVSDEAISGTTVDTVGYLYREIAKKIVEKAEEILIGIITASPASATSTACGVPTYNGGTPAEDTIIQAIAFLSGQARDLRIAMNRQTYATFVGLGLKAKYNVDVFDGLRDRVVFTDKLPAFSSATSGATYVIVGDFGYGALANLPEGDGIAIKYDDLSLAEKDLVKLVGRQYVGLGVVADKAFVKITKGAASI